MTTTTEVWLPTHCPDWCAGDHAQALEEGNTPEESREHRGEAGSTHTPELRSPYTRREERVGGIAWDVDLRQTVGADHSLGPRIVGLSIHTWSRSDRTGLVDARLTTGEARVLAAQLIHAADRMDLL